MIKAKKTTARYLVFWAVSDGSASDRFAAQMCHMSWDCAEARSLPLCHLGCKLTAYGDMRVCHNDRRAQRPAIMACKSDSTGSSRPGAGAVALNQMVCRSQGTKSECMLDAEIVGAY